MYQAASRRNFLTLSAGVAAAGAAAALTPGEAQAQNTQDELSRLRSARRILLKGGIVLTMDRQIGDFANADVMIENGRIAAIRPNLQAGDAFVVQATNRIIIPGFVDTHSHSYQGLLRSALPNGIVEPDYVRDVQNALTPAYRTQDVYAGVLITALALLDMGTTSVVDISQSNHTPEHSDALVKALQDAGIRAVCAYSRGIGPQADYPGGVLKFRERHFSSTDQLLTVALATSIDPKTFLFAREHDLRSVLHIRVNSDPLIAIGRAGLMKPGDEYVHCAHLNEEAWRFIKDTGGRTAHSPPLEMAMAHGFPAIQDALDHGMRPSLSCDHAATVASDMFGMMRTVFNLQRLGILQRIRKGEKDTPPLLTAREVLEFATIEGARTAQLEPKIGSLTQGKEADLVVLRADKLDVWPHNNAYGTVTNLMNPSHVESVFVAGKVRKWRGTLVDVDQARVRRLVQESRDAVFKAAGFKVELLG